MNMVWRLTKRRTTQFETLYKGYEGLATVYGMLRESEDDCEETKYTVKGRDFCLDMCFVTDVLSPVVEMMTAAQSLSLLLWCSRRWWPRLKALLSEI